MEHVEFTHTAGMKREQAEARLRETETGVLSLADGDEAYAIPLAHHYDGGDAVRFRLGVADDSEKVPYLDATDRACYVVYDYESHDRSWSVLVRGPIRAVTEGDEGFDVAEVNRQFPEIRVFDEDVAALEVRLYELGIETITGRTTVDS